MAFLFRHASSEASKTKNEQISAVKSVHIDKNNNMSISPDSTTSSSPPSAPAGHSSASNAPASPLSDGSNPGNYEELHRKCKDVFPMCFDGAKAMLQKGLSSHFQIAHTLSMSAQNTGYKFGATYVGTKHKSPTDAFPVLLGDMDLKGNTSATVIHEFGQRWRCKLQSQIAGGNFAAFQTTGEYRTSNSTLSFTAANIDLIGNSGILVGQYLRRVHRRVDLGAEYVYQYAKQIPGNKISVLSYSARYNADQFTASATVGASQMHFCYYHKQHDNLSFGVEWESNFRMQESTTSFGYQIEIPSDGVTFRAQADTNGTVGGVFEKKLSNIPFTLALSGMINHAKAQSKFGIGLIIG